MTKSQHDELSQSSTSVEVAASYSGFGITVEGDVGYSQSKAEAASKFNEIVRTKTISLGSPPPSDGNILTWASTVKDNPVPCT